MRKTLTVYAVDSNGNKFRVAGYDEETALKVVKDETVKNICHADFLLAVNDKGTIVATSFPKYVKTSDGYIGTFQYLDFGEFPVYRFEGGDRIADSWEIKNGSDNRKDLEI